MPTPLQLFSPTPTNSPVQALTCHTCTLSPNSTTLVVTSGPHITCYSLPPGHSSIDPNDDINLLWTAELSFPSKVRKQVANEKMGGNRWNMDEEAVEAHDSELDVHLPPNANLDTKVDYNKDDEDDGEVIRKKKLRIRKTQKDNITFLRDKLDRHPGVATTVSFDSEGRQLCVGTSMGLLILVDASDGHFFSLIRQCDSSFYNNQSSDASVASSATDVTNAGISSRITPLTIYFATFSPAADLIFSSSESGIATIHSPSTGVLLFTLSNRQNLTDVDLVGREIDEWEKSRGFMSGFEVKIVIRAGCFDGNGERVFTGGEGDGVDVWDIAGVVDADSRADADADADAAEVTGGGDAAESKVLSKPKHTLKAHSSWINVLNSEFGLLASADILGKVVLTDLQTYDVVWACRCHLSVVTGVEFMFDSGEKYVATSGIDGKVSFWAVGNDVLTRVGHSEVEVDKRCHNTNDDENNILPPSLLIGGHNGGVKCFSVGRTAEVTDVIDFSRISENEQSTTSTTLCCTTGTDERILLHYLPPSVTSILALPAHSRSPWAVAKRDTIRGCSTSPCSRYLSTWGIGR